MDFFKQLSVISEGIDLTMRIMGKNGDLTMSIMPDGIEGVQPLLLTGTADELDQCFFESIKEPMEATRQALVNLNGYKEELKQLEADRQQEIKDKKNKPAAPAPAAKKDAKVKAKTKPAPVAKAATKKPAPAKPEKTIEPVKPEGPVQMSLV